MQERGSGEAPSGGDRSDQQALRRRVRALLAAGALPPRPPDQLWAGYGSGRPCDICGRALEAAEVEYELRVAEGRLLHVHRACLAAWDEEGQAGGV